jgi:uncharacterized protein YraI
MKRYIYALIVASLLISSCNMPDTGGSADPSAVTAAALTVEAALNQTPLASPTAGDESQKTPNPEGTPFASFEDVTNCRTGPGVNYPAVTQIPPGLSVEVVGFFAPNFWIVKTDKGECWVAGQFVTPSGDVSVVPTFTAPPLPEGGAPDSVNVEWNISCNYETTQADVSLVWKDKEDESGYRVVRNDTMIAELPADSTKYGCDHFTFRSDCWLSGDRFQCGRRYEQ